MKLCLTVTLVVALFSYAHSQQTISGQVKDDTGQPVEFANILLFQLPDSTMITGVPTETGGAFQFSKVDTGQYYVQAMMIGYADAFSEVVDLTNGQSDLSLTITLHPSAQLLETVEVTAKVPVLEQRADRMVVNVAESLTALNGSLMDVLKKVPGVIVSNGRLSLAGQTNPTILINGRTTQYMDMDALMREMPSDNIQKIEVIHQPGAEFDAAGTGPIINIILKSNKLFGTNGSVQLGVGKATYWRYNGSFTLNHRQGDLNLYGGAGYSHNAFNESLLLDRVIFGDTYTQENQQPSLPHTQRANIGADWYISDKHTVGIALSGLKSDNDRTWLNQTLIEYNSDASPTEELHTENRLERDWAYWTATGYYSFKIDTAGQKLDLNVDYAGFDNQAASFVETRSTNGNNDSYDSQRVNRPGETVIAAVKLDYSKPFHKNLTLDLGGKYSFADLDNDLLTESLQNDAWQINTGLSNHFLFEESIIAGYGKLTAKTGKWDFTAGLRYEESQSDGYSITLDSSISRNIQQLFPSATISRALNDKLGIGLAYSYRIDRPNYRNLNPYVLYLDPFTLDRGNPLLRPEFTHSTKLNLTYEKQPFFNLEYARTKDQMTFVTEQDDETGVTSATVVNLEKFEKYGGSLFFPLDFIPKFSGYGGVMAYYNKFDSEYLNDQFQVNVWTITAFLQANIDLPWDVKGEIGGWFTNGGQDGIVAFEHLYGVSIGLERKFLNDKLSVQFGVDDLFFRYFIGNINYANVVADVDSRWDTQIVNLRLNWRFGNQHLKKTEKRGSGASDEINRAKSN